MKNKIFITTVLLLIVLVFTACANTTVVNDRPTVCTMDYTPVCAKVDVQCIKAPCPPISQTFSNKCEAEAAGGFDITDGECQFECDAQNPCKNEGFDCYKFEDVSTPFCYNDDPCERCESGQCLILESYPMQVRCE
ncbi:hypothetical protein GOV04_05240 [Candidatus Woesearchaeota archaeon]|nr:hypothetical protein [Candidatus Woesearchaeota archaeon]